MAKHGQLGPAMASNDQPWSAMPRHGVRWRALKKAAMWNKAALWFVNLCQVLVPMAAWRYFLSGVIILTQFTL